MFLKKIDNLFEIIFKNFYFSAHFILRFGLGVSFIIHGLSKFPLPPQNLMNYKQIKIVNLKKSEY